MSMVLMNQSGRIFAPMSQTCQNYSFCLIITHFSPWNFHFCLIWANKIGEIKQKKWKILYHFIIYWAFSWLNPKIIKHFDNWMLASLHELSWPVQNWDLISFSMHILIMLDLWTHKRFVRVAEPARAVTWTISLYYGGIDFANPPVS